MGNDNAEDATDSLGFPGGGNDDGNEPRVVIVGGGVIGCAAARELAPDHRVLVLERGMIAGEATARAAGEVTMSTTYTDYPAIAEFANDFFRTFNGTGPFEYIETESVELVTPEREDVARDHVEGLRAGGADVSFLDSGEVEARWPRIDASTFVGGVRFSGTGFLDPYTLATTLQAEAEGRGARFETGVAVTDVLVDDEVDGTDATERANVSEGTNGDERITGVETDRGTVHADAVVVAAGWRTPELLGNHLQIPVRPYRTQCIVLRPESPIGDTFPMGWIPGEHVYFRRETNGDVLVGGWSFAEDDPEGASEAADEAFRDHVADLAPRFIRTDGALRVVDGWAGVDGATPDTRPIVDAPDDAPEGLVVATGFHGRGVMTSPVAGRLVRCLIAGEEPPFPTDPFVLSRFDDRSPDFEFHSISAGE